MRKPLKIGITGGIGSGKTTTTQLFKQLGAPVYLADERARWLMNNTPQIINKVKKVFGKNAYKDHELNRTHIAAMAFKDKHLINQLNHIVHPAVFKDFDVWMQQQTFPYVIKEAALLFESGSYLDLDAIISVFAPADVRIKRTILRDHTNRDAVINRMKNQMDDEDKARSADYIILNDGEELLLPQVLNLHHQFLAH